VPSFPRTASAALVGVAVVASIGACGTVTVGHSLRDTAARHSGLPAPSTSPIAAPVQQAAAPAAAPDPDPEPVLAPEGRTAFGDSVMLGAEAELVKAKVRVDALVGRQFHSGIVLLRRAVGSGTLPRNVIVHLGTNGSVAVDDCRKIVDKVGETRRLFFVTVHGPRSWMAADNAHLAACAASYPEGRVVLVPWDSTSKKHPEWFYADGIHLNGKGRAAYAALVSATVDARGL
jgi:hypothetical protein